MLALNIALALLIKLILEEGILLIVSQVLAQV